MKKDKYVGKFYKDWEILSICNEKSSDGHKQYKAKCTKCGFVNEHCKINDLHKIKICNHNRSVWYSTKLAKSYYAMIRRCQDHNDKDYRFYGAKGISVCKEWLDDFKSFNDWAVTNGYKDGLTIDRIDPDKNYCPENCRWVTAYENSKWKSITNVITVNGITDSGRGWADRLNLSTNYINKYIRKYGLENCKEYIKQLLNK